MDSSIELDLSETVRRVQDDGDGYDLQVVEEPESSLDEFRARAARPAQGNLLEG